MTTPALATDLERDEGFRSHAYADTKGVCTIGYGHTPADPDWVWSQDQAQAQLSVDIYQTCAQLDREMPWWRTLDEVRQDALANMAFNIGVGGVLGFHLMLAALQAGDWIHASAQMLLSDWAADPPEGVGARAARLADMIRTGVRP